MLADLCVAVLFVMHFPQDIFKTLADKRRVCRKRYYVRVRAYKLDENKNKVYGSWSKVKRVKVR